MYYRFIPTSMACRSYVGDKTIVYQKFKSIEDGLEAARLNGVCLREQNWSILECSWFTEKRIMLKTLWRQRYLAKEILKDEISEIYQFTA